MKATPGSTRRRARGVAADAAAVQVRVDIEDVAAHLFSVTLTVPQPLPRQRLSLPVWIPGSYLVREFARHLSALVATQGSRPVALRQVDKSSWVADASGDEPLVVRYRAYAFDTSVRAAFLDSSRGFFNGTSLVLRAEGHETREHRLEIGPLPADWHVATAMPAQRIDRRGIGHYRAADYDELIDHPFEMGTGWVGHFEAVGVPHRFVVTGAWPDFDGERLLADATRICEAQLRFWHGSPPAARPQRPAAADAGVRAAAPFERYLFLLQAVDDGYGGLEHRSSTALIAGRRDLPRRPGDAAAAPRAGADAAPAEPADGYVTLLGLISHEYFHAWNVKRLRPREFARLDLARENHTELLWFFEGFTSYYDDLMLLRAGLIDAPRYLRLLAKAVTGVLGTPGRRSQSVAQASFDAWTRYYRPDENTPNSTVSYYTKGSLVALALDLTLRAGGTGTLDDAMRLLWQRFDGGPIGEDDIAQALTDVAGRAMAPTLRRFVHGRDDLPLRELLEGAGVGWEPASASVAQRLGVRVSESALTGIKITHVLRDGLGERSGLAAGDELIAVDGWRLRRLDELPRLLPTRGRARGVAVRDQRLFEFDLAVRAFAATASAPAAPGVTLSLARDPGEVQRARRRAWLGA